MSLKSETFHAVMCDFPACGSLWDADEYTYSTEPYANAPEMRESGWYVGESTEGDFCPDHAEKVDCQHNDEGVCIVCGESAEYEDQHAVPIPATPEGELKVMLKRISKAVDSECRIALYRVDRQLGIDRLGGPGTLRGRTDAALNGIHARACLSIRPDLNGRDIRLLQETAK